MTHVVGSTSDSNESQIGDTRKVSSSSKKENSPLEQVVNNNKSENFKSIADQDVPSENTSKTLTAESTDKAVNSAPSDPEGPKRDLVIDLSNPKAPPADPILSPLGTKLGRFAISKPSNSAQNSSTETHSQPLEVLSINTENCSSLEPTTVITEINRDGQRSPEIHATVSCEKHHVRLVRAESKASSTTDTSSDGTTPDAKGDEKSDQKAASVEADPSINLDEGTTPPVAETGAKPAVKGRFQVKPAAVNDQEAVTATDDKAASSADHEAGGTDHIEATGTTDFKAVSITDNKAVATTHVEENRSTDLEAVGVIEDQAVETTDHLAVCTTDQKAVSVTDDNAAGATDHKAVATTDIKAVGNTDHKAVRITDHKAVGVTDNSAAGNAGHKAVGTTDIKAVGTTDIKAVGTTDIKAVGTTDIKAVGTTDIKAVSTTDIKAVCTTDIKAVGTTDIKAVGTTDIKAVGTTDIKAVGTADHKAVGAADIKAVGTADVKVVGTADHKAVCAADRKAGGEAVRKLSDTRTPLSRTNSRDSSQGARVKPQIVPEGVNQKQPVMKRKSLEDKPLSKPADQWQGSPALHKSEPALHGKVSTNVKSQWNDRSHSNTKTQPLFRVGSGEDVDETAPSPRTAADSPRKCLSPTGQYPRDGIFDVPDSTRPGPPDQTCYTHTDSCDKSVPPDLISDTSSVTSSCIGSPAITPSITPASSFESLLNLEPAKVARPAQAGSQTSDKINFESINLNSVSILYQSSLSFI